MKLTKLERLFLDTSNGETVLTTSEFIELCIYNNIEVSPTEQKKIHKYISYIYVYGYGTAYTKSKSKIFDIVTKYIKTLENIIVDKHKLIILEDSITKYEDSFGRLTPIDRIKYEAELKENNIFNSDSVRIYILEKENKKRADFLKYMAS